MPHLAFFEMPLFLLIDIKYFQLLISEIRTLAKLGKWLDYKLQEI